MISSSSPSSEREALERYSSFQITRSFPLEPAPLQVMQVRKRDTTRIYALKTIRKAHIVDRKEITHTLAERLVLARVNNPFIVPLKFSFQSEQKLYLVLASVHHSPFTPTSQLIRQSSFVNGGELFHHLQREQRFNEERSRFYSAELLLALEHLHELDVVYRSVNCPCRSI